MNQLKYVCRSLYQETAGLELKCNAITFKVSSKSTVPLSKIPLPTEQLLNFIKTCDERRIKELRTIIIKSPRDVCDALGEPVQLLEALANFCRENPHITVKYVVTSFNYDRDPIGITSSMPPMGRLPAATADQPPYIGEVIIKGIKLIRTLRDVDLENKAPMAIRLYLVADRWMGQEWKEERPNSAWTAPNLRFYPTGDFFNINNLFQEGRSHSRVLNFEEHQDFWIQMVKSWAYDGF